MARRLWMLHQLQNRFDHIGDVREATTLGSVSIDGERLIAHRLSHEARDDHTVMARLPRAHRVEQSEDNHWQPMLTVVGKPKKLIDHLARCIRPSTLVGGAEKYVVAFGEGNAC